MADYPEREESFETLVEFDERGCMPGWVSHGSKCLFVPHWTMNFTEAHQFCAEIDGQIYTPKQKSQITLPLEVRNGLAEKYYWIGYTLASSTATTFPPPLIDLNGETAPGWTVDPSPSGELTRSVFQWKWAKVWTEKMKRYIQSKYGLTSTVSNWF